MMRALSEVRGVLSLKTNLSRGGTSFVGRGQELNEIAARFEAGARLVTITGAGGIGKTRLAIRFAEEHAAWYGAAGAGGTWLCELRGVRDVPSLCGAVASALGISMHGERTSEVNIGRALSRRGPTLLVLDDLDLLMGGAKDVLQRWLLVASTARILATSSGTLGCAGEVQVPLAPLALPGSTNLPAVESVELFVTRGRRACPELVVRPEELADIAAIVRGLQGIPLAIELTAARVSTRSIVTIRARLGRLEGPGVAQDDVDRAELLRVVITDACAQLDAVEEACLLACSGFAGGFTLAAVEAVLSSTDPGVLGMLAALHGLSLIRAIRPTELCGELRFALHETIREYVAGKLAAKPELAAAMAARHAGFYARAGRALVRRVMVEGDAEPLVCLEHDLDNILVAYAFSLADSNPSGVVHTLELAIAADLALARRGIVEQRWLLLDQAIEKARMATEGVLRTDVITAMLARGRASHQMGRLPAARADFEASLTIANRLGSELQKSAAQLWIGTLAETADSSGAARESLLRALGAIAPSGPVARRCAAEVHARLACMYSREGDLDAATRELRAAIGLYRTTNQAAELTAALHMAAVTVMAQRRHDDALLLVDEGLALAQRSGNCLLTGALLTVRGALLRECGNLDLALEHQVRAAELLKTVGDGPREVEALSRLAEVLLVRGQRDDAQRVLERASALNGAPDDDSVPHTGIMWHLLGRPDPDALLALVGTPAAAERSAPAALRIRAGARAFRPPRAVVDIDLHRRVPLCRILLALARRRIDAPGERLAMGEVFAAGWPGERLSEAACINRVNVAFTALRNIGLRAFLVSGPRGFALTLLCPCELEESN